MFDRDEIPLDNTPNKLYIDQNSNKKVIEMTKYDFTQKGLDKLYNEFVTKIKKNKIIV